MLRQGNRLIGSAGCLAVLNNASNSQAKIKVVIVDAYPVARWGARRFLSQQQDIEVVAEAETAAEAAELVRSVSPRVVIIDLVAPGALTAVVELVRVGDTGVVAFSALDSWQHVEEFLNAGGTAFVSKRAPLDHLLAAVYAAARGHVWISPELREMMQNSSENLQTQRELLTSREREVALMIAEGLTSRQIADRLCVSLKTVESHRYRIFKKLNIRRSAQLVDYVIRTGLTSGSS